MIKKKLIPMSHINLFRTVTEMQPMVKEHHEKHKLWRYKRDIDSKKSILYHWGPMIESIRLLIREWKND